MENGAVVRSVLLMQDDSLNTPMHNLWENYGDMVPAALLELILESCDDNFVTIQDLLSVRNTHGMTVMHLLFGDAACSTAIFQSVIYPLSSAITEENNGQTVATKRTTTTTTTTATHPIHIGDDDGESPIHFACYVGLEPEKLNLLLRGHHHEGHPNFNKHETITMYRKAILQSLFCLSKDNVLPIDALFHWFVQEYEEDIHHSITYPASQEVDYENLIPYLLNHDQNFVDRTLYEKIKRELWPRINAILDFIVDTTDWFKENSHIRELSSFVHIAACVSTFPSAVLKTAELCSLEYCSQPFLTMKEEIVEMTGPNKVIPLHIAAATKPRQLYSYCQSTIYEGYVEVDTDNTDIEATTIWQSSREPRSMIQYMLEKEKRAAEIVDSRGRLPLHIAIENGLGYYSNLKPLVEAYFHGLQIRHPENYLYPFMLAAVFNELDAVYGLLIKDPSVLQII